MLKFTRKLNQHNGADDLENTLLQHGADKDMAQLLIQQQQDLYAIFGEYSFQKDSVIQRCSLTDIFEYSILPVTIISSKSGRYIPGRLPIIFDVFSLANQRLLFIFSDYKFKKINKIKVYIPSDKDSTFCLTSNMLEDIKLIHPQVLLNWCSQNVDFYLQDKSIIFDPEKLNPARQHYAHTKIMIEKANLVIHHLP